MQLSPTVAVLYALIVSSYATPIFNIFSNLALNVDVLDNTSDRKDGAIVKRYVHPHNADASLKQVSLQSLVDDVEHSLFQSALSVGSLAHVKEAAVPEITATNKKEHNHATTENSVAKTSEPMAQSLEILLQTTEKVPAIDGVPAHLLIDRVSVQEYYGSLPMIAPFEVKLPQQTTATIKKDHLTDKIVATTISSTENPNNARTSTQNTEDTRQHLLLPTSTDATSVHVATTAKTAEDILNKVAVSSTTAIKTSTSESPAVVSEVHSTETSTSTSTESTTTTVTALPTTKTPQVRLKEAEEDLKEKVAEIEAEPFIFSARI